MLRSNIVNKFRRKMMEALNCNKIKFWGHQQHMRTKQVIFSTRSSLIQLRWDLTLAWSYHKNLVGTSFKGDWERVFKCVCVCIYGVLWLCVCVCVSMENGFFCVCVCVCECACAFWAQIWKKLKLLTCKMLPILFNIL